MGSMTFIADRQNGDKPVTVTFEVPAGAVERILMAFADYYGPTFIDPAAPDKGNRPRSGSELVEAWAKKCMGDALNLVHGFEARVASEKAVASVEPINYETK